MRGLKINKIQWENLRVPLLLVAIVLFAFFLRTYWAVGPSIQYGYAVSGGSDSYYHERIINYILTSKHQLLNDPMLNYPIGMDNPRPPLFHWGIVMFSYIFYPFMSPWHSAVLMLILFPAIWGSLTVIPVYLLGREAYNKRVGLLAAFFLAIMPGFITRSIATQADWDAFDLFFIAWSFYFFLKALKVVHYKYWIKDWFKKEDVKNGLFEFFGENKEALIYSALSGAAIGALALAWKGYTYALAILVVYLFVQIFINRFRNKSNLHMVIFIGIYMLVAFGMAFPWYFITHRIGQWFDVPFFMIGGVFLLAFILEITGKYPWPFVFLLASVIIAGALIFINIFMPDFWNLIVSGQGYFVKSKLYSTIAEAQPASLGYLAMSFGVAIFVLAFGGIVLLLYKIKKEKEEYYLFFVFYSVIAIYMAISAARFIFNASPAFALTGAIAVVWLLEILHFRESMEEYRKYGGSARKKLKSAMKFSQVAFVLVLAFLLVVPTVWSAVDAGIPYETKKKYDKQIYNVMPSFMRPNETTYNKSSPWYLGAFGYSLPKPEYPWERAWKWLRHQDNNTPPENRPAFVSWWDYGFSAIRQGQHPAVADNFQNGYQMAAQIITAQNESEVISLFIIRLIEGDYYKHHKEISKGMVHILQKYFTPEQVKNIEAAMKNPGQFRDKVLSDPDYYGYYSNDISDKNTEYAYLKGLFAHHPESKLINLYDDVRNYTGKDIRYFAVDYRLFPFSGRNTGIFYAPAKLGDRRIHQYGGTVVPYDFYTLKAVDEYGNEYDLDKVPGKVRIVNYKIEYKPMFYNSMLYRTFIGYSGKEIGAGDGIPGISPGMYNYYPMQAWDMSHFKLVYRTAYWNPYKDYQNHTKDWKPISIEEALKYQKEGKGTVELNPPAYQVLPNDVVIVKFYEGAIIDGTVKLTNGEPVKHVRVTLLDEYKIPHVSVYTDSKGHFRIPAVAGNLTLVVSTNGKLNKMKLVEQTILYHGEINVTQEQAERLKPNYIIQKQITLKPSNLDGMVYFDVNGNKKYDEGTDMKVQNGVFVLRNNTYGFNKTSKIVNGLYHINNIPPHTYTADLILNGRYFKDVENISISGGSNLTKDIGITPSTIYGNITYENGAPAANVTVELDGVYAKYKVNTDQNGSYKVMVVPDNYTVVAYHGDYRSDKDTVIINMWNYTTSENLTLKHAFSLDGVLMYKRYIMPHITLKLTSELLPHSIYLLTTNAQGRFSTNIPGGIYSIYVTTYAGDIRVVYAGTITLNKDMSLSLNMEKGYRISGYVQAPKDVNNAEIGIYGNNIFYRAFANNTGYFEAYLPAGKYIISSVGFGDKQTPYFDREIIHVTENMEVSLSLQKAYNVTGSVYYYRSNDTGSETKKLITNGLAMLYDAHGVYEIRNIPPDGKFVLPTTINYHVRVKLWGYTQSKVISNGNNKVEVRVMPSLIHVHGKIHGNVNNITVNIRFTLHDQNYTKTYTVKNARYYYDTYLPPGNYTIEFYGFNRTYQLNNYSLQLSMGFAEKWENISYRAYANVTVHTIANHVIWYIHGHNYTAGKSVYILIGNYSVYAYGASSANIIAVSIYHNTDLEIPLYPAYFVNLYVTNYTGSPSVQIYTNHVQISAHANAILPAGSYKFIVNETKKEGHNYFNYYAEEDKYIQANTTIALNVIKTKLLGELHGKVLADGKAIQNCMLKIYSLNDAGNKTLFTNSAGMYQVYLTPGRYMIYTYFIAGSEKYANITFINITSRHTTLNINMQKGYYVRGSTYLKGKATPTIIKFKSKGGEIDVQSSGYYWVVLPSGGYNVQTNEYRHEYGSKVRYYFNGNINITKDTDLDIQMKRDTYHLVEGTVVAADEQVKPNSTMGVTLQLSNKGNIPEKVKLEGIGSWSIIGSNEYSIYPSKNKIVSVKVRVPIAAKYGNNSFQIRILFSGLSRDITVNTHVSEIYRGNLSEKLVSWTNNSLVYEIKINNRGNTAVNYTLSILNDEELNAKGWNMKILVNGRAQNFINVPAQSTKKVKVIATTTVENPSTIVPITFSAYGGKEYMIELPLYHPEVSYSALYVEGKNVQNYSGVNIDNYTYGIWISVVVLAAIIIIIGRYRR